jgi:drug/metabolite transporter (DMT)-like permease
LQGAMYIGAYIYVIVGILTTALAQISLKIATAHKILSPIWVMLLVLSLSAYAASFLSYYMALKHYDISKIQPLMMVSILSIISIYGFLAGESFNYWRISGLVLAMASIFMIARS